MNVFKMKNWMLLGLIVSLFFSVYTLYWYFVVNPYGQEREYKCLVLDKLGTSGSGRYASEHFYLVLRNGDYNFDIIVSPTDYSLCEIGKTYIFHLREMDFRQTPKKNFLYTFLPLLVWAVFFVLVPFFYFGYVEARKV